MMVMGYVDRAERLEHNPEKPVPDLIRDGEPVSDKIMLRRKARAWLRFNQVR